MRRPGVPGDTVQAFERGLAVLRSFGRATPRQTLSDVARATGLSRATARRLLHTLLAGGYVRRGDDGHFELTARVLELGYAYLASHGVAELAMPLLRELSAVVDESSSVAVLDGADVVHVARVPVDRVMTPSLGVGSRFPAYRTSVGRALLASRSATEVAAAWAAPDPLPATVHTATDRAALDDALDRVRSRGWALVDQELELGVRSVAAPVRRGTDVVAAVAVDTHTSRTSVDALRERVVPALLDVAERLSDALTTHRP